MQVGKCRYLYFPWWHFVIHIFHSEKLLQPPSIVLGIIPSDQTNICIQQYAKTHSKQITQNWTDIKSPAINAWKRTAEEIREMERITYRLRNREEEFIRNWSKWVREIDGVE